MHEKSYKEINKKNYEKIVLLKGLEMPLLEFSFVMIYIINKMLKYCLSFLKVIFLNTL